MKKIDLTGKNFGRLTVLKEDPIRRNNRVFWICQCECGNEVSVGRNELQSGQTKSCGCLKLKNEGLTTRTNYKNNRLYNIWRGMKKRCTLPSDKDYKNYGGRGISLCSEWLNDFLTFYNWAINNGYSEELTIDRINYDGNYEPSNCRWVTIKEQNNNKRSNIFFTYKGKTQSMSKWCDEFGVSYEKIKSKYETLKKHNNLNFDNLFNQYI